MRAELIAGASAQPRRGAGRQRGVIGWVRAQFGDEGTGFGEPGSYARLVHGGVEVGDHVVGGLATTAVQPGDVAGSH